MGIRITDRIPMYGLKGCAARRMECIKGLMKVFSVRFGEKWRRRRRSIMRLAVHAVPYRRLKKWRLVILIKGHTLEECMGNRGTGKSRNLKFQTAKIDRNISDLT